MDRRVKERLVGATILVALIILIVPELLSGPSRHAAMPPESPPAETVRNVTVDLATSKATPAEDGAPASATASASTGIAGEPNETASRGVEAAGERAAPPGSAATPAAAPTVATLKAQQPGATAAEAAPAHHRWAVQLGSFASRVNADKLATQLKAHDFSVYVSATGTGRASRYRVRIGPLADRSAAEQLQSKLAKAGHPATLLPP